MENLHLKNLTQKPNGLIMLKKLNNPEYYYNNKPIPKELIKEIELYIKSFTYKNKDIEEFIDEYIESLKRGYITKDLHTTKQIIHLLYKYKLNELDIGSEINCDEINNYLIENNICIAVFPDEIEIYFKPFTYRRVELSIYTKQETNKISEITCDFM